MSLLEFPKGIIMKSEEGLKLMEDMEKYGCEGDSEEDRENLRVRLITQFWFIKTIRELVDENDFFQK